MMTQETSRRRGSPLAMLVLLVAVWIGGRAVVWENPFPAVLDLPVAETLFAEAQPRDGPNDPPADPPLMANASPDMVRGEDVVQTPLLASAFGRSTSSGWAGLSHAMPAVIQTNDRHFADARLTPPIVAAGHQFLMAAAFRIDWNVEAPNAQLASSGNKVDAYYQLSANTDEAPRTITLARPSIDRWSLDAFAFYRAGSNSALIGQGRVPVYGASQMAANLQYRVAPSSRHDPRLYVRAYRAFVAEGENEAAIGASARPLAAVPVRVAAELRVIDNTFGTDLRPAAYAITELPSQRLPFDTRLEVYGAAGYVGGDAATPFGEGQAAITRKFAQFERGNDQSARLRLGAGAWGGAQEGASRVDIGPTLQVELNVGDVPARVSLDWRERVAGDAAPASGIAATLSTRF